MYKVALFMKIFFKITLILTIFCFPVNSEVIKEIKVSGNQRVSSETVKVFSGIKKNSDLIRELYQNKI